MAQSASLFGLQKSTIQRIQPMTFIRNQDKVNISYVSV